MTAAVTLGCIDEARIYCNGEGLLMNIHDSGQDQTMAVTDKLFAGSIPEVYDRYLVPLIFESYARDLAERVLQVGPERVLETAAGTGVLTRAMSSRLPARARIVATDLNQPMLDHAQRTSPRDDRVIWRQADAMALPFEDETYDVVACQFGVMFFPDMIRACREVYRVLKPGSHFLFNVWDNILVNDFANVVTQALIEHFKDDPPLFMARTPHGHHDVARIKRQLRASGFASISVETREHKSKAPSALDVAIAYCQGTPLRNEIQARDPSRLEEATHAAADLLARRFGNGAIEGRIRAHVFSVTR